ncbi:MAG: hypothetical protein D6790_03055, partial [Caldilineae bacterium]
PGTIWMRRQIVEHMPEPLSPLFEDLYLRQGLNTAVEKLMAAMEEIGGTGLDFESMVPHGFAATINGYAYTTGSFKMTPRNLWSILRIYARIHRFFKVKAFDWEGTVLPGYQATIARWQALDLTQAEDETLLEGIREMAAADGAYWFGSAAKLGLSRIMDALFGRLLRSFLFRGALPSPPPGSAAFLRGFDSPAMDAQADMEALADQIRESDALRALVQRTPAEQLLDGLAAHPEGQPVVEGIRRYLDAYGHQIYNLDFAVPTQNEDPLPMLLSLKALVEHPPEEDARSRRARLAAERDALVEQTLRRLNPLSRRLFRWVWRWTKKYAPYRELVMFYMGAAWPTVRRLAHELGRRLTEAGTLADPDDIYYLDSQEIREAIAARARGESLPHLAQVAQERRALREARKQLTPPPKVPVNSTIRFGPIKLSMFDPIPSGAANDGPVLKGNAVSSGRVTAPASVIRTVDEFQRMQPGAILVCTTTTPAWTPLFSQAAGLVTDVGGALAHGSIVAREYGIPAVMGTGVATERIKPGMIITVDGDAGVVILEEGLSSWREDERNAII